MAASARVFNFTTRTPDPQPSECANFDDTYTVTNVAAIKTQTGGVDQGSGLSVAVIPCPKASVVTSLGYELTSNWDW
jgi:hypothetical protein